MNNQQQQWAIFLAVHHALRVTYGPAATLWGKGGHCAATALIGAALTELVTGLPCQPVSGAGFIFLNDGRRLGYEPSQVDWERGLYHCFFLAAGVPVDFRLCLIPDFLRLHLVAHPHRFPLYAWGELPTWLQLQPEEKATYRIQDIYDSLKQLPIYNSFSQAAHLVTSGCIPQAGALLGAACKGFMQHYQQEYDIAKGYSRVV
jgi:hypothetical protein